MNRWWQHGILWATTNGKTLFKKARMSCTKVTADGVLHQQRQHVVFVGWTWCRTSRHIGCNFVPKKELLLTVAQVHCDHVKQNKGGGEGRGGQGGFNPTFEMSHSGSPPQPAKLVWLLVLFLRFYGGASAVSPGIEFLICVQSSLVTSYICSTLLLPPSSPIAVFFLFIVPDVHNSRAHIKLDTLF